MALIQCTECGQMISENAVSCPKCGHPTWATFPTNQNGSSPEVQAYLKKFNVGAFLLSGWWAIFHRVWIGLIAFILPFIPVIGQIGAIVFSIYLGVKGSEMAWEVDEEKNLESFIAREEKWKTTSILLVGIILVFMGVLVVLVCSN